MKIILPLPPSVNSAYYHNHDRHMTFLSKPAKDWFEEIGWILKMYKNLKPINNYIYLDLDFWLPRKNCDAHNYLKLLCDGLQKYGIVENDKYLLTRIQCIEFDSVNPRVQLELKPLTKIICKNNPRRNNLHSHYHGFEFVSHYPNQSELTLKMAKSRIKNPNYLY